MKAFRLIFALLLALLLLFSVCACGYPEVESTEEERATVLTFDGVHNVPYELYRFIFLSERGALDEGTTPSFDDLDSKTKQELATFYAVFSLAEKYGVDAYGENINEAIKTGIEDAIEGDGGYGKHKTYLSEIGKLYMNDSVYRFLLRYSALEAVLGGKLRDDGIISSAKGTVLAYMNSEQCVRATWIYIPYTALPNYTDADLADRVARAKAASDSEFLEMTHEVIPDAYTDAELETGFYIGKYQLDPYYQTLTDTVFSLEIGETSDLIHSGDGVYIVRRLPKDASYLEDEDNLADFTEYYLLNTYYGMLSAEAARLLSTVAVTDVYETLTLDNIKMGEEE